MKISFRQKFAVLAKANGWSLAHAEGFVDGQAVRRRGRLPSKYALVGIDDYSQGFRAGYFDRRRIGSPGSEHLTSSGAAAECARRA